MINYPQIDPVALSLGPIQVHWYGLMYLVGFMGAWWLCLRRAKQPNSGWTPQQVSDFIFYGALGVILGGRIGYVLFYDFSNFIAAPWRIVLLNQGGMSFHGGALGVLAAIAIFARKTNKRFLAAMDFGVPMVPIGLGAGRIGNFINGELWGRATEVSWGMVFPADVLQLTRHPSQLYQALTEGLLLFVVLWLYSRHPRPMGAVTGLFGVGYGISRFTTEFFREPDAHIGYIAFDWLTMGQLLSLPLIMVGIGLMVWGYKTHPVTQQAK